jgi:signal transduction histidine kinase
MSIRIKLMLSYIAMLLIPVILTIIAAFLIATVYFGVFFKYYDLNRDNKSIKSDIEKSNKVIEQVSLEASTNPEKFSDSKYVFNTDTVLMRYDSGIIILKQNIPIYVSKLIKSPELLYRLDVVKWDTDNFKIIRTNGPVSVTFSGSRLNNLPAQRSNPKTYAVSKYNFVFSDKEVGTAYVFTLIDPAKQFLTRYFTILVAVIILILILTNILMTIFVSRSLVKPLQYLKKAADEIKDGNLNFEVKYKSKDEIGQLAGAFEEMRAKLKESIEIEQQYEINRKELVSNISHDIKTPITAVKGYVEGIMDGVADTPDKMNKYIKTIYTKTNEIDKLIDELFLYSKLDLKKLAFNFEKIDLKSYLSDCMEELAFDFEGKGIELKFECTIQGKIFAIADREKLYRVIMNIVGNSAKYMDNNTGVIKLELTQESSEVIINISDNGKGIVEEDLPFIFDRFYRGDPSRNTAMGGSGLGLAISKHIIEEHGGRIWAQSEIGVGTTISFTLKKF